jgi:hypothetical protein
MNDLCLPEAYKVVFAVAPATNAGALNGQRVSLKHAHRFFIVVNMTQGNAAQSTITIERATDIAGTDNGVITANAKIWSNLACATNDRLVRRTDAVNYQLDAGLANKLVVFEVDPASLGATAGNVQYDCIRVVIGASNAGNIASAVYVIAPRYPSKAASAPSVVVD